jgi:hypothetical protein
MTLSLLIVKIADLCGFPPDSTMIKYIWQQGWSDLEHVTTIGVDEVKDFCTYREDGTYDARPMQIHLRMFKAFLLFYKRKCRELQTILDEEDVLDISKPEFKEYCRSDDYVVDLAADGLPAKTNAYSRGANANAADATDTSDSLTAQEFRKGVKRDKSHYTDLKDDKYFTTWNRGFVATANMHHTHHKLMTDLFYLYLHYQYYNKCHLLTLSIEKE